MFARLTNRDQTSTSKDETLLYILGGIVVMFFICNIPAAINLLFINETVKKRVDYQVFRAMANLLEITNHAAQFYIFCACSTDYRITFLHKFPCFKTYYVTADRFKSFIKREKPDSGEKTQTLVNNGNYAVNSKIGSSQKRSTTLTCEVVSAGREEIAKDQDTTDIQLASGEEDLSEESDSLLKYGIVTDDNGTTYL
uniref:G-protein coupled receptors family 1 profile domain-containing protein n=1 Tax=Acrobeloides nanus TaxID=290746 RepID=A0A914D5R7_9BILA